MDSKSINIYECDDFSLRLEYGETLALLHLPSVSKFNRSVLIKIQNKVMEVLDFLLDLGYNGVWAGCPSDNNQIKRLLFLLGFDYIRDEDNVSMYSLGVK